jgi:cruciform cutting endonuclease 1
MALKIPPALKLSQLKTLAFKCGISTSGTKTLLTQRLIEEIVPTIKHGSNTPRILSIDMGIRNLAYCILDLPNSIKYPSTCLPSIYSWRRLAISTAPLKSNLSSTPVLKEAFDPLTLASHAYTLLRTSLLLHNPTHILIERQRFRSMGSPHILEWTVRVNMFESMLHAVLHTLKAEDIWDGQILAVAPGKVGSFWMGEDGGESAKIAGAVREDVVATAELVGGRHKKVRKTQSAKIRNKGIKIDLVKNWLENGVMVTLGNEAEATAKGYMEKWVRKPGRKPGKSVAKIVGEETVEEMGKLDDLADSLLQGMAWIQWEENKRIAVKHGVDALLNY